MTDLLKQSLAKNISILETVFNTKSSKLDALVHEN